MPIPWRKKYFIKYISQPYYCQQLGVFSQKSISKEIQENFMIKIPAKFVKVSLNFNSDNFFVSDMERKKNYILSLKNSYEILFKSFSKGRKHAIKVGVRNDLFVAKTTLLPLVNIKKKFYNYEGFSEEKLQLINKEVLENDKGFVLGVFNKEELLGGGLFLVSNNRIVYLFSAFNDEGRKQQAASFLIKSIIEKNEKSDFILDFEGGNLSNTAKFFKSFGSEIEEYHQISYSKYLLF